MDYIYSDIDYKLNTKNKDLKLSLDVQAINNSIRNILLTQKHSLPGKPDFGSDIDKVLFEQMDEITLSLIENIIRNELEKWEPRILVDSIDFKIYAQEQRIAVLITYIILKLNLIETVSITVGV